MIRKIKIEEFLSLAKQYPVLDVRSPGEYTHAHIPGALSLPLFSDEERKVVGTAYKQQGREVAIKIGLDYFGVKMRKMVEEVETNATNSKSQTPNSTVLVHCWRGGMRSAGVAWLLDLYGFKVYTLDGGYKAFRKWALLQFEQQYHFRIVGGYTGSGKTKVLNELAACGHTVIDLEGIAHHKGSAFGDLGESEQPTAEMFENALALQLATLKDCNAIWLEDESRRIGNVNMPQSLWNTMRRSPVYFLEVPFEERLDYITAGYGKFSKEALVNSTLRIQKRLGNQNARSAVNYLVEGNFKEAFRILLSYYDKYYSQGLQARENLNDLLSVIPCATTDEKKNCEMILSKYAHISNANCTN